jgi:hypothetical protein
MPTADLVISLTVREDEIREVRLTAQSPLGVMLLSDISDTGGEA